MEDNLRNFEIAKKRLNILLKNKPSDVKVKKELLRIEQRIRWIKQDELQKRKKN